MENIMIKKLFILFKIARKLALSDAIKIISKFHEPPIIIKIFLSLLSISFFKNNYQSNKITDEEKLCTSIQEMGTTFIKLGQFLSTRPDIIEKLYLFSLKNYRIVCLHFQFMKRKK